MNKNDLPCTANDNAAKKKFSGTAISFLEACSLTLPLRPNYEKPCIEIGSRLTETTISSHIRCHRIGIYVRAERHPHDVTISMTMETPGTANGHEDWIDKTVAPGGYYNGSAIHQPYGHLETALKVLSREIFYPDLIDPLLVTLMKFDTAQARFAQRAWWRIKANRPQWLRTGAFFDTNVTSIGR